MNVRIEETVQRRMVAEQSMGKEIVVPSEEEQHFCILKFVFAGE